MSHQVARVTTKGAAAGLVVAVTIALAVIVSCGDPKPSASEGSPAIGAPVSSCRTPQAGCACTRGTDVACGKRVDGDLNFIHCYEGVRSCGPSGVYGDCAEGSVVTKSLSTIHTAGLGTTGPCGGTETTPLRVCTSGKQQGEYCTSNVDCGGGVKKCRGGPNDGSSCKKEKDCADPGECTSFNGTCSGGPRNTFGCNSLADCPGGISCLPAGGGGTCGNFTGVCDNGSEDGEACSADAQCPGGQCRPGHGHCQGGKENAKKCRHNKHCKGGASCSGEDAGAPGTIDPCDPYCNATVDTALGLDAGAGFAVSNGGLVSTAGGVCGNGTLTTTEECDDGNMLSGDGCSGGCLLEVGFKCPTAGMPCVATTCGDTIKEGAEQCDDGNLRPFDGCSPTCRLEPVCTTGGCAAICGDGLKFASEACDDGNTTNGDGCSSTCTIEPTATCTVVTAGLPPSITVPAIYRDFTPATSPDFEFPFSGPGSLATGVLPGIAQTFLAADQEPAFLATRSAVTSATTFNQWWHDGPTNRIVLGSVTLLKQPDNSYLYNSQLTPQPTAYVSFFPIDGRGFGNFAATGHNYHFTSELRYPFTFQGGEVLDFLGDDDLWVFINGRLAVDLGGAHNPAAGSITLTPANATLFGLTAGNTYRLDVFQAERHSTGSSYKLTLRGFVQARSNCSLPSKTTFIRDFQAVCSVGESPVWQLFRWKAAVPAATSIDFRAATAATLAAVPPSPPAAAPTTVPIGSATPSNSPLAGPVVWVNEVDAVPNPVPVSQHLKVDGSTSSKTFLRVFMTFNALGPLSPRLDEWQQLYDCIPNE